MKHEAFRELLALRLYGEIDSDEERGLLLHLDQCRACADFARELESGLGRARALHAEAATSDLPAGWEQGLADATDALRRRRWMREALLVGCGIAAGVLAMLLAASWRTPAAREVRVATLDPDAPAFLRFRGDTPPPLATAGGPATRFSAWQAR